MPGKVWEENNLSILKLQRLHRWSLGMGKYFHPTHHNGCNYLSILGIKLNRVRKRGHSLAGPIRTRSFMSNQIINVLNSSRNNEEEHIISSWYVRCWIHVLSACIWTTRLWLFCKQTHSVHGEMSANASSIHPSPKVMADFFRHKNQHDALIQFAQFLVNLWSVC